MVYKSSKALASGAGSVTQINTGTGLTGGPITTSGAISIAPGSANTLAGFDNTGAFAGVTVGSGLSLVAGTITATGGGTGTVTTTGSPASGNLSKFSGATSITNGDLSGDITTSGTLITTLATVNANVGSFGSSTSIPNFTVNGKGLITAAGGNVVTAPAGTLTGTTLASNVVASSLTSVGTLATLTVTATITGNVSGNAGTATTLATGRTISITGDLAYTSPSFDGSGNVTAAGTLATVNGNVGSFTNASITVNGKGLITAASNGTAPVTSISVATANGFAGSSSGGATPALTLTTTINGILSGNGTAISAASTTGSGSVVLATSPTITTAVLGSSTATTQSPGDNSTKVATTAYVQAAVFATTTIAACKYATTAALPTATYSNGASGVGATLTGVGLGALSIDSVTPSVADRILVKNQASTFQNGIYVVTTVGSVGAAFVLTRSTDYNQSTDIDLGDQVFITAGATLANTTWTQNGTEDPIMGTDPITFAQTAGPGSYTAGNGITITGVSIAIDTSVTVDKTTAQTLTNKTLTSPVLTTPDLGTPSALVGTNITGTGASFTAGNVTTNANLTGPITSSGNATSIASQTGTGTKFVVDTSPTLVTPTLGVATATTINKVTITAPATGSTLTVNDGVTLTAPATTNVLVISGTAKLSVGTSTPTSPATGDLWVDTT